MRIILISKYGDTAAVAGRLRDDGHDVRLCVLEKDFADTWDGMLPHLKSVQEVIAARPDLVIVAESNILTEAESVRRAGIPVLGNHPLAQPLEQKRWFGVEVAKKNGVLVPYTEPFNRPEEAIKIVKAADKRMVVKFDRGESMSSFVGRDNDDVIAFLHSVNGRKEFSKTGIVQELIDGKTEFNVEVWFSNGNPISPATGAIEQKKFMPGNMGPNTGCESTITWCYPSFYSRAVDDTWGRGTMFQWIKSHNYTGPLDMAFFLGNDDKPYFLEFTPRFGLNAVFGTLTAFEGDIGQFFYDIATGRAHTMPVRSDEFQFVVNLSIPPYPYEIKEWEVESQPVELKDEKGITPWYSYVKKAKDKLVSTGSYGLLASLSVTGNRKSLDDNINKLKKYLKASEITNKQYRIDAGDQIEGLKYLEKGRFL